MAANVDDKFIGVALAICASIVVGSSYVVTKKGLIHAAEKYGFTGEGFGYTRCPIWWCGIIMLVMGEMMNTAAYAFAPAVLVTPLGALSVLISTLMGSYFLGETLNVVGKVGCVACLQGSILLVLHAPADKPIETVDEILHLAMQPSFVFYFVGVATLAGYLIWKVAPVHGRKNPLVYLSICSSVGSLSVMSDKAFGIAVKLTAGGNNQFTHPSTYFFVLVLIVATLTQMNYLNKAMSEFPASLVNAIYYVGFTTCTLSASMILYQGLNTSNSTSIISMTCGFLLNFVGVALLTLSKTTRPKGNLMDSVQGTKLPLLEPSHVRYDNVRTSMDIESVREKPTEIDFKYKC